MSSLLIRWESDIPSDVREIIEPVLSRWENLIPTWCQDFNVRYDHQTQAMGRAIINYRSRWAVLVLTGEWVGSPALDRENAVIHELVHINLEPLTCPVGRIIEDVLEKDTPARELADSMFTDGMEAAVEDLARGLGRLICP